ncbi:MAG: ATP synthase F1 subunit gamma [Wolinella sp.]
MGSNLKEIRKKITSVKNTQKTTKAMKLVSTSKLKKAEEMAKRSRVYAERISSVFHEIKSKIEKNGASSLESPYFFSGESRDVKMVDIIFVTADKGLCGGFNAATIKEVSRLMAEYKSMGIKVRLRAIGKKGIGYFSFNEVELLDKVSDLSATPDYERAAEFIKRATTDFINGVTDKVLLVHNGFKNMISQELKVRDILPLDVVPDIERQNNGACLVEVEPDEQEREILDQLAKKYIEFNMYYALIDSLAAEHSARMQAMDAASNNAGELVKSLTVAYNKARQEAITTELVEINTGVESMK